MQNKSDSYSVPPALQQIANTFRLIGWIGFWTQLVLGIVSSISLLFAAPAAGGGGTNPGSGPGILLAVCGILLLGASIYWAFRYTRLSRQLQSPTPSQRPKKADTIQLLRMGLMISLVGMLLTILGIQAIVGGLVAKSFTQASTALNVNPAQLIQPRDIFVVQAAANIILAQFAGIMTSLWLLNRVTRQS